MGFPDIPDFPPCLNIFPDFPDIPEIKWGDDHGWNMKSNFIHTLFLGTPLFWGSGYQTTYKGDFENFTN